MKSGQTSNVFYTFGFILLYIHLFLNIWSLTRGIGFFNPPNSQLTITPLGMSRFPIQMSFTELILVGGFILFTIVGLVVERLRLVRLKKEAEAGWHYRNRLKQYYAIISIILVLWTTIHGYVVLKEFDWVWISGSAVILLYSIFLILFPRIKHKKA